MMDIKDVNNGLLNLLQANRANLQGTAVWKAKKRRLLK